MYDFLVTILVFFLVLSVLVFVHEFGHFIVARSLGVGVNRFSIGFGPRIFGWTMGRTEYRLSAIPLGGYVKMVGEQPGDDVDSGDISASFTHKPVWKRLLIVAAGPFSNILFAIVLFCLLVFFNGLPYIDPVIGEIGDHSPARRAGLEFRDRIMSVEGEEIRSWEAFVKKIRKTSENGEVLLEVQRGDKLLEKRITPEKYPFPDLLGGTEMRMSIGAVPYVAPVIGHVQEGSPAEKAGLLVDDRILSINGIPVVSWMQVGHIIRGQKDAPLHMEVERKNALFSLNLEAQKKIVDDGKGGKAEIYIIGISSLDFEKVYYPNIWHSMVWSLEKNYEIARLTAVSVVRLIERKISFRENMGGPIMIAQVTGQEARKGLDNLMWLIGVISMSLALVNLLPIPVLDGGHIFFYLIEIIRRKPLSIETQEKAQMVGLSILLIFMVFVFYNDIMRIAGK